MPSVPIRRLVVAAATMTLLACAAAGCSSPSGGDDADASEAAISASETGLVYFHGMSGLGFTRDMVVKQDSADDVLAPRMSDAQLQATPPKSVLDFLASHQSSTLSGYSLGRIPVLRLMKANAPGIARVVMVDPTFDGSGDLGRTSGGPITRAWLDGDPERTFISCTATRRAHWAARRRT